MSPDLEVREARDEDLGQILELASSSLGWVPDEEYAAFYRWKHHDNPFGRSPGWVALDGERVVGLRLWLRWRFVEGRRRWEAVRAVDTATHPDYQGKGIFRMLTTSSLDALHEMGIEHVFNTPNEQSRPGYLKMGWETVGKLPVAARFRSPAAAVQALRARVPAEQWSLPCNAGMAAHEVLADAEEVEWLLDLRPGEGIRTDLGVEVLRWRYGFPALRYRALRDNDGIVLFRLRRRGPVTECVVGHVLARGPAASRRLVRRAARASGAHQALLLTRHAPVRSGYVPLPGAGPILTWRRLGATTMPALERWDLTMGDVELF